jgi:hypothetical protein
MRVNGSNAATWTYDTRGRVTAEQRMFAAVPTPYTTSWTYNPADLPVTMTYPDGEVVTNTYDTDRMLLNRVTATGTFGSATYVDSTSYDAAARVTDRTLGTGGLKQKFVYYAWDNQGGALHVAGAGTGMSGGRVLAVVIDPITPSTLYAGTEGGGIFKSADAGKTWAAANNGLTDPDILALAIDPAGPATLYAGTKSSGVFRSMDGGASWGPVNDGLTASSVKILVIDPSVGTVYAGTQGGGVFVTEDVE